MGGYREILRAQCLHIGDEESAARLDTFSATMLDALLASGFQFPSASSLYRSRPWLDVTCMNSMTRHFCFGGPRSRVRGARNIHRYIDASPVVCIEIYGILMDMFIAGKAHNFRLPASTLSGGFSGATYKVMAFLWPAWLTVGPEIGKLEAYLEDVRTITTDMGAERLVPDVENCFGAFCNDIGMAASP